MDSQFNAIDYSHQLQAVGVSQTQAETHAKLLSEALANCSASRADLNSLGEKLSTRMEAFETKFNARIDVLEARMDLEIARVRGELKLLRWMFATNTAMLIAIIVKIYFP
jgi:hypothetical protein